MGYWREALFIASVTHGEIPCAGKGAQIVRSIAPLKNLP
jgi:hypothetical protein